MGLSLLRGADCHCGDALCDEEGGLSVEEAARKRDEVRLDRIVHLRRAVRMVADGGRSSLKKQAAHGTVCSARCCTSSPPSHRYASRTPDVISVPPQRSPLACWAPRKALCHNPIHRRPSQHCRHNRASQQHPIRLGAQEAATALTDQLNLTATASDTLAPNTVELTVGADFDVERFLNRDGSTPEAVTSPTTPVTTVAAGASGAEAPAPTNLTRMSAQDVPCVR